MIDSFFWWTGFVFSGLCTLSMLWFILCRLVDFVYRTGGYHYRFIKFLQNEYFSSKK